MLQSLLLAATCVFAEDMVVKNVRRLGEEGIEDLTFWEPTDGPIYTEPCKAADNDPTTKLNPQCNYAGTCIEEEGYDNYCVCCELDPITLEPMEFMGEADCPGWQDGRFQDTILGLECATLDEFVSYHTEFYVPESEGETFTCYEDDTIVGGKGFELPFKSLHEHAEDCYAEAGYPGMIVKDGCRNCTPGEPCTVCHRENAHECDTFTTGMLLTVGTDLHTFYNRACFNSDNPIPAIYEQDRCPDNYDQGYKAYMTFKKVTYTDPLADAKCIASKMGKAEDFFKGASNTLVITTPNYGSGIARRKAPGSSEVTTTQEDCSKITDPCACLGDCGWSTSDGGACMLGSTTVCNECSTLPGCITEECVDSGCPKEYDSKRVCQCTADCDDYGNCCSDQDQCFGGGSSEGEAVCVRHKDDSTCELVPNDDPCLLANLCEIDGSCDCDMPPMVTEKEEHPCDCKESFKWEGVTYTECTDVADTKKWCYVKDGAQCGKKATPSQVNVGEYYKYCDCGDYTQPCSCEAPKCGWSSSKQVCEKAGKSWTSCEECPSQGGCIDRDCVEDMCPADYDPMRLCQCNEDCEKYGNCCSDASSCKCSDITEPCNCLPPFCGWSSSDNMCQSSRKSTTSCEECGDGSVTCIETECAAAECAAFDPARRCQCNDKCTEYGNCCSDAGICRDCDCMDEFTWQGKTHTECTITSPFGESWCYVKGGASCPYATESTVNAGSYYVEYCGNPCDCKDVFEFDGNEYTECTAVDDDTPWCYVVDPSKCAFSTRSSTNPHEAYRYCEEKTDNYSSVHDRKTCTYVRKVNKKGKLDVKRFQLKHQAAAACDAEPDCYGIMNKRCTGRDGTGVEKKKFFMCDVNGNEKTSSKACLWMED